MDKESLRKKLDAAFRQHHNGYDGQECVGCGELWYNLEPEEGLGFHLTDVVLKILEEENA